MYEDIETETSYRYLRRIISKLEEPICILGGWAVFFTVNDKYKKRTGRVYIGSRDIDFGFNNIKSFKKTASILENELNFDFVSFRFYKNIHTESGKDITQDEAKLLPQHLIFPIYVDPIMAYQDKELKTKLGFTLVDEPLLKYVFLDNKFREEIIKFGKKLIMPVQEILLATKINAVVLREKEHKRFKDICDIAALCLYGEDSIDEIINKSKSFISKDRLDMFRKINFEEDIINCCKILGLELNIVKLVIDKLREL